MARRRPLRRGALHGTTAESADTADLTLQYFHLKFNAARQLAPRLTSEPLPERLEHIGMQARLAYASEVAPGEGLTFVDRQDASKVRLQWLRTLHTRAVELSVVHGIKYQRYTRGMKVATGVKVAISAVLAALLLILNDSHSDVIPTLGVAMGTLYMLAACAPHFSDFQGLAKHHLTCEKSFRELATEVSAFLISLAKQQQAEKAGRPLGEAIENSDRQDASPLLAEASDVSLHDGSTPEPGLPNAPETVSEGEEEEGDGGAYRSSTYAGNGAMSTEMHAAKGRYGRLPSLSGGGSTQPAMHAKAGRFMALSEEESEFLTAASAANTALNTDASDPEGINMQLQDWYRAALEYSFAHSLMADAYQRQAEGINYATVAVAGLAEALLLHDMWLPSAYFGAISGGLFLVVTCLDAYLALIGVEQQIQRHDAAARNFDWLQSQMEEALICHPKNGDTDPLFSLVEKYKSEVTSSPPLTRRFLESWKDEEGDTLFGFLLTESADDNASLRWADEVLQSLNEEKGENDEEEEV